MTILFPNGIEEKVVPRDGAAFCVNELQDLVDGYIGIESVNDKLMIYAEDGEDRIFNPTATNLIRECGIDKLISGNVLLGSREEIRL